MVAAHGAELLVAVVQKSVFKERCIFRSTLPVADRIGRHPQGAGDLHQAAQPGQGSREDYEKHQREKAQIKKDGSLVRIPAEPGDKDADADRQDRACDRNDSSCVQINTPFLTHWIINIKVDFIIEKKPDAVKQNREF